MKRLLPILLEFNRADLTFEINFKDPAPLRGQKKKRGL